MADAAERWHGGRRLKCLLKRFRPTRVREFQPGGFWASCSVCFDWLSKLTPPQRTIAICLSNLQEYGVFEEEHSLRILMERSRQFKQPLGAECGRHEQQVIRSYRTCFMMLEKKNTAPTRCNIYEFYVILAVILHTEESWEDFFKCQTQCVYFFFLIIIILFPGFYIITWHARYNIFQISWIYFTRPSKKEVIVNLWKGEGP